MMVCSLVLAHALVTSAPTQSLGMVPSVYYKVVENEETWGYFYVRSDSPSRVEATLIDSVGRSRMTGWIVSEEGDDSYLLFDMFAGNESQGEVVFIPETFGRQAELEWRPLGDASYKFDLEVIAFDRVETQALEGVIKTSLRVPEFLDSLLRTQVTGPMIEEARSFNEMFFEEVLEMAQLEYHNGLPHWMDSRTDLYYMSDQLVSFGVFDSSYTGGIQLREVIVGRTFLVTDESAELIDYERLFIDPEHCQQFIIDFCYKDLSSRDDGNYVAEGTVKQLELEDVNYWVFEPDALVVLFSPLEMNIQAVGIVEVRIPRKEISELIKPEIRAAWK